MSKWSDQEAVGDAGSDSGVGALRKSWDTLSPLGRPSTNLLTSKLFIAALED